MNIETLNRYKEEGWLMNQFHPTLPLVIWNYTPKTQYEQFWDGITLICRGLVTDLDGNIVSRGFPKFFNIEENRHTPTDDFEIFEKLDGQYIGVFWYNGEMVVNSRGSFTSKYAIEARRILDERYDWVLNSFNVSLGYPNLTYCFELIGFEQIVVSYPKSDLILTGIFHYGNDIFNGNNWCSVLNIVKKYSGLDYKNIKQLNWQNSEGFVVRFSNGSRCKIKFEDYVNLHRQMTNLSTTAIWEALRDGKPISTILNDVPDEFYDKIHEYESNLKNQFKLIEKTCLNYFKGLSDLDRKRFAEIVLKLKWYAILFAMYDNKDYSILIWNQVKPKFEKL